MKPVIEKSAFGFVARVEHPGGEVDCMTDGGCSRSLESFLPRALEWLDDVDYEGEREFDLPHGEE